MKINWEEKDIICGMVVGKALKGEQFIIGYTVWHGQQITPRSNYCLISLLDGCVHKPGTAQELANILTNSGYIPNIVLGLYKGVKGHE